MTRVTKKINTAGLDYETKKKLALNSELISTRIQLSDLEIDTNGQISIHGMRMASEMNVGNQLLKILKLNPAFLKRFEKLTDDKTKNSLIQMVKSGLALTDVKKQTITVLGNPRTQLVTNILPGEKDHISNRFAIDQFERIANTYPNLSLNAFDIQPNGGISLSMISKDVVNPKLDPRIVPGTHNRIKGEEFNPGINFKNDPLSGILASSFVYRLICTNGLTIQENLAELAMSQLSDQSLEKFFGGISKLGENGFVPFSFDENLQRAMNTNASFGELKDARRIMINNSALTDSDLKEFLPEFSSEIHKLASMGVDYVNCTDIQLHNYPINMKVWDVVNRVTDFGSHDYGFAANNDSMQRLAGNMFNRKTYDANNLLPILNISLT